jgi:hypothetical protein
MASGASPAGALTRCTGRLRGGAPAEAVGSDAAFAQPLILVLVAFAAQFLALTVLLLLLAQPALHLLALQLLVGCAAVLLAIERAVALALLELAVEIALALLRLGKRLGRRIARADGEQWQGDGGAAQQGSAVDHAFNVARRSGFSKAQKS